MSGLVWKGINCWRATETGFGKWLNFLGNHIKATIKMINPHCPAASLNTCSRDLPTKSLKKLCAELAKSRYGGWEAWEKLIFRPLTSEERIPSFPMLAKGHRRMDAHPHVGHRLPSEIRSTCGATKQTSARHDWLEALDENRNGTSLHNKKI